MANYQTTSELIDQQKQWVQDTHGKWVGQIEWSDVEYVQTSSLKPSELNKDGMPTNPPSPEKGHQSIYSSSEELIQALTNALECGEPLPPLVVSEVNVLDGHHRWIAANRAKCETVPILRISL